MKTKKEGKEIVVKFMDLKHYACGFLLKGLFGKHLEHCNHSFIRCMCLKMPTFLRLVFNSASISAPKFPPVLQSMNKNEKLITT